MLNQEIDNEYIESTSSESSESTIDSLIFEDNDPLFQNAWEEIWSEPVFRPPISMYLGARLASLKNAKNMRGNTINEFENFIFKSSAAEHTKLFKKRCERLRLFEKMMAPPEVIVNFSKILFVKDINNIVLDKAPCKYSNHCYKENCPFSHPPREQKQRTNFFRPQGAQVEPKRPSLFRPAQVEPPAKRPSLFRPAQVEPPAKRPSLFRPAPPAQSPKPPSLFRPAPRLF